ncbi:hypothetical protein [Pseudoalteromonas mariniglutinosa]|uniref:hypothetical protein n=1 Tax=Pseudoalteromonas mariniglutinosa TaxID=206042 RepID=UPI00384F2F79
MSHVYWSEWYFLWGWFLWFGVWFIVVSNFGYWLERYHLYRHHYNTHLSKSRVSARSAVKKI